MKFYFVLDLLLALAINDRRYFASASESHTETYTYYTIVSRQDCVQRSSRSCGGWWIFSSCSSSYYTECSVAYQQVAQSGTKCQTGWTSAACNVPICQTPCIDGKVCTAPNTCDCVQTGQGCQSVPCDATNNCYPGSCLSNPTCTCPPGFSGPNCINIDKTPDISSCQIQLYSAATGAVFKSIACEAPGIDPRNTTWIGTQSISQIQVTWTSNYVQPISLPSRSFASYVGNSPVPIGVAETGFKITTGAITGVFQRCAETNGQTPQGTVNCNIIKPYGDFGITAQHNQSVSLVVSSSLGGHKDGANSPTIPGSSFPPQQFTATAISRSVILRFDLLPPVHCLSIPNNDCQMFAIQLDQDITTEPVIQPKFYNWTDQGSGIINFHVELFFMQPDVNNLLVNAAGTLASTDVDPNKNNFVFTCTTSGVYSIEVTVQDQAGNSAKARKLFIFNKDSKLQTFPDKPVYIQEADPNTGYAWITKFDNPRNGGYIPLTLVWTGHFSSNAQFDSSWGLPAKAWDASIGIDDRYKDKYGRRSIYALTNMPNGIVAYGVAFLVDAVGGGKGLIPQNLVGINATISSYALPIPNLPDGSSIVILLQCADVSGGTETVSLTVNVDRSPPEVTEAKFLTNGIDESTSSMSLNASDVSSGIMQISFGIYDSEVKNLIYSGSAGPTRRDAPPSSSGRKKRLVPPCRANDATCYCIPTGACYNFIQVVEIDNCRLDRLPGHTFEFRFTVTNGANMTSSEQTFAMGKLSLNCRKDVSVAGIVAGCVLGVLFLVALIIIIILVVRVRVYKRPVPQPLENFRKTVRNKFSSITNDRPQMEENIVYAGAGEPRRNDLDHKQQNNRQVPTPSKAKQYEEDAYVYKGAGDSYAYSKDEPQVGLLSNKDLETGDVIAEGRFAVIRNGRLTKGHENFAVATKGLKRHFIDADFKLMEDKIALQRKLPPNAYVVKFLGWLEEPRESGPVMVLEHCDMPLKDWLSQLKKVDSNATENMLDFTSNIASGVAFLHDNKVVHRRLAVRNVLLKRQGEEQGLVAKLIGFGPNKEDRDGDSSSVPLKWFAPETMETFNNSSPVYTNKSDVWSFAITVWEIFSKGKVPYPELSSGKVKALLLKEKRMVLTCPDMCQQEFFQRVVLPCWDFTPDRRPTFPSICSNIQSYRRGDEGPRQDYIYKDQTYEGSSELYIDAA